MSEVKRWDFEPYDEGLVEWLGGRYVLASDYDALAATVSEQAALIESLQNRWASRPLSVEDTAALEKENDRLAARVEELTAAFWALEASLDAYHIKPDAPIRVAARLALADGTS